MGNATSGEAALVMVDRPFIPSLETSEDIEVVLTVKGETVTLGEWPARAIAVPPPARGFLRATAWAVNPDDDEERREIGQILVHHTSLEAFEEPYIQLWLGLLDPSIVPQSQYCGIDEAHKCFTNSIEVAKDPEQPKVCLTIAAIRPELLTASRVQDMLEYQRELTEKPMMQLFQNTNDIIQGLSRQYTQTCRDLRCLRREFRTKENVFQGFVRVEKVNKEETKQRWEENTAKTAAKFAKMFTGVMAKEIVTSWRKATFEKSMDNLKTKLANANKKTALIVGQFLGKNATPEQLGRMMHKVLKAWAKSAKQWRTQLKMIHRMVPLDGHIAMEMAIHGWKQVMATEEREQPAKVGLDFTVKGVSHWDLEADTDLMSSLAACVKAGLFQLCAKEGYTNLPAGAMKMALEHRNDGSRVKCQMTPGSSNDAAILKKKIDPKLKLIGTDLGTRVIAVPSIFTVCAGPISITEMATSYIRHQSQQARRDDLADKFDQVIDWYQKVDHLYVQQLILRSWLSDTQMCNHKEAHKKSLDEQLDQRHKEAQAREARANASHQAAKNSVALMVKKWQMGNIQGLLVETFSVWHEYTALWVQKRKGQAAVRLSLHKFFEGETKAIMSQVMSLWRKHAHHVAELGRHRQAINDALVKAMLGEQRGTLAMCISSWAHDAKSCKAQKVADDAVRQEAKKYEDFVNDMKDGHGKELSRHLTEAQIRKEQAHEATAMMLRRWAAGETKGLLMTIMAEWRRFVEIQQDLMRRREKAKLAVMGWLEGKDKAIVHMCFTHFVHFYEREKITKSKSESSQEQAKKYEDFVNDMKVAHGKELERHLSEAEIKKEQAHEATTMMLRRWAAGETKGLMSTIIAEWKRFLDIEKDLTRRHEAAKMSVMKFIEGDNRAVVHMCFTHFVHFHETEKIHAKSSEEAKKYQQFVNEMKDNQGKELERHLTEAQIKQEQAHEATQMMLRRWAVGETKGLMMTVIAEWRRFVEIQQDLQRRHEAAKVSVMKWIEGENRAIVHVCWTHFVHFHQLEKIHREKSKEASNYEGFVNDLNDKTAKELERHLTAEQVRKEQAHEATQMMLRKWAAGETKGILMTIIAEWNRFVEIQKELIRRHEAAKMSVMRWIEGESKALVHMCWTHFVHYHETEKIHRAKAKEQSKYEEFLNDMKAGHEKELDRHLTEAEKRKEQAHEATTMMLRRWAMGETKGLQSTIICEWNRFVDIQKDLKRRHEAAKLSVMKWVEGDDKALVHMCFTHWVHNHEQEKVHRLHSEEANKYQAFVNEMKDAHGKELERHMTDAQIRKEQAHEATTMMLRKWAAGDQKGLVMTICAEWQRFVSIQKDLQRRHEQAKLSVMKFIEGDNRAIVHLCFTHFAHYAEQEKVHAAHNKALQESLDSVFAEANGKLSELEIKQQTAKNAVELALRKWAKGETEGLRAEVFDVWHHHCAKIAAAARQRAAVQASLMKFFEGETAGLIHTVFEKWHKEVAKKLALLRQRAAVRESLCKFLEGEMHGIMHSTFLSWQGFTTEAKLHGLHTKEFERQRQEMQDLLSDAAKKYADDAQSQRERDKEAKHIAVEYALKSWEGGKEHAAVDQVFHHWQAYASKRAMAGRGRQAVHAALLKAMMGECRAAAQLCFTNWSSDAAHCKIQREADEKDRKASGEWQRYIDEQKESHGKELERIMTEGERRKEAAHEASQMMLKKWFLGEEKGLMCSIVQEWRRYVDILQDLQRRHEATKQSVMSWIEGQDKAVVHMCWTHWVHYNEQQQMHHKHDDLQSNLDKLGDDRLAWQSEQEARHARTKNAVELAVRKWTMGNVAALKKEVFDVWHNGVAQEKQKRREQAAVRQQLEKFLRGDKLGDMHICFSSWHKLSSGQVALRTQRNAVQAQLRQFLEGETRGLQDTCFKEWKHFLEGAKQMRASSKEAEEKHLLNAIEVAKQKDAKLRAMQALGLKDVKGVKMHHFLLWSTAYMQAKEARIQAKKHDHMIDKAMLAMAGNDAKVILGVLMNEWHMLLPDKMLLKAEHAHQVEAEERVRLFKLHKKDVQRMMAKALMSDGMMAVHVALGSWHKLIQSKRLRQGGDAMKKETMKTAGAAMNKAINKWASDAPRVLLHTVLRALNEEVKEARQARAHGNVRDVRQAWRASALHGGRHFVNLFEGRELHVYLVHWVVAINLSKWRRSSGFLQECADLNATTDSSREQLLAWRAEATTQRSRNLGVDCHHIMKHARKQHAEGLHAVRESETMRTHMAVNLFAADQRAQEALEHGDKLGVATGSLQGEMHTHNLTLDALEHELLLLESQIANSDVLGKKKSAFVQRLVSA